MSIGIYSGRSFAVSVCRSVLPCLLTLTAVGGGGVGVVDVVIVGGGGVCGVCIDVVVGVCAGVVVIVVV